MNILITGGAGYIGSQLIRALGQDHRFDGDCVTIYDSMRDSRYQSLMGLPSGVCYDFIPGDIEDLDSLTAAVRNCDVVVHLAALTNAVVSFDRIAETEAINFKGTENVASAAARSPRVRRVLYASTCSVYGETAGLVNEDSECKPESPYAVNKLAGEGRVQALSAQTGGRVSGTSLRLATVFGQSPGLRVHTVVNIFALHGALGMPIQVHGDGGQSRPFVHVRDASSAFIFALLTEETQNGIYNVVGENASVRQVLRYIEPRFPRLNVRHALGRHLNQISYEVDGSRFQQLGWRPTLRVEDGIDEFARAVAPFANLPARPLVRG